MFGVKYLELMKVLKMKLFILLSICATTLAYDDIGDIDVDKIVADPALTLKYLDCFVDKGPCTDAMSTIKGHITESILNACAKCSPKEKHMAEEFTFNVLANYPDVIADIRQKYDPDGTKMKKIVLEISKY